MVRLFLFLSIWLCVCGCSDERLSYPVEVLFSEGGGEVDIPVSTIGGVPTEVQTLLWGDRDELLSMLKEGLNATNEEFKETVIEFALDKICLIDAQREYYTKYLDAEGIAILGDRLVYDKFFFAAQEAILAMTSKHPEMRDFLTPHHGFRVILYQDYMAASSVPEFKRDSWLRRNLPIPGGWCGDKVCVSRIGAAGGVDVYHYVRLSTLVHEFGHAMHRAIRQLDTTFQSRLEAAYTRAMESGSVWWEGTYAYTNANEYWAEGVQFWFYAAADLESHLHPRATTLHHAVTSVSFPFGDDTSFRQMLLDTDPLLYALLDEWLPLVDLHTIERKWGDRFWE